MIIWGWGKVTSSKKGAVCTRGCSYCNTTSDWQLTVRRTWFTLFFIPVIPYHTDYCVACPNCGSYVAITKPQYQELQEKISTGSVYLSGNSNSGIENNM